MGGNQSKSTLQDNSTSPGIRGKKYLLTNDDISRYLNVALPPLQDGNSFLRQAADLTTTEEAKQWDVLVTPEVSAITESTTEKNNLITYWFGTDDFSKVLKDRLAESTKVKILFPYNIADQHWETVEVQLTRKDKAYEVALKIYDPLGSDTVEKRKSDLSLLATVITDSFLPKAFEGDHTITKDHESKKRQGDGTSCGAIVAEDIVNLAKGKLLQSYDTQACQELRTKIADTIAGINKDIEEDDNNKDDDEVSSTTSSDTIETLEDDNKK